MDEIFRKCFDFRGPITNSLVVGKQFSSIKIAACNGASPNRFSEAFIDFEMGSPVPLDWFWCDAIVEIVENYKKNTIRIRDRDLILTRLRDCVKFLNNRDNIEHLRKVKDVKTEAEIQAILAHHLFVQLAPSAEFKMDGSHWPVDLDKKCPACKSDLKNSFANTSIGNHKVWYGFPDILIDRTTVKIDATLEEDFEDTEDYTWQEPVTKKIKHEPDHTNDIEIGAGGEGSDLVSDNFTTSIEVKKDAGFSSERSIQQALAQTITNAFLQTKLNPKLKDLCIPSFIVSDSKMRILMYNCEQDTLYMSIDMPLWNDVGDLNEGTVVCLWLALNYENFQNLVKEDDLRSIGVETSLFQKLLPENVVSIYRHQLSRCLPKKTKKATDPTPLTVFNRRIISSKYNQTVQSKLQSMIDVYFT